MSGERLAFERITVGRLPGFERQGFELSGLSPGINVVHGPNASGKTTVARALRWLLWPPEGAAATGVSLEAAGRLGDRDLLLAIDHGRVERRVGGNEVGVLPLPPAEHADRYRLALHEILQDEARGEDLAQQVTREALGGYDVDAAVAAVGGLAKPTSSRKADQAFQAAAEEVRELAHAQADLARQAAGLDDLRAERDEAREAERRLREVEAALAWRAADRSLAAAERRVAAFPPAVARLGGDEAERIARLTAEIADAEAEREGCRARLAEARRRLGEVPPPPEAVGEELLARLDGEARELASLERERARAEDELAAARARAERARSALGERATEPLLESVGEAAWDGLVGLARRAERLDAERAELRAEEAGLGDPREPGEAPEVARLERAAAYLRAWLRFQGGAPRALVAATIALGLLLGAGIAGGLWIHPALWGLAGAAVLLALWVESQERDRRRVRAELQEKYEALGLEAPASWQVRAVDALAEAIEGRGRDARLDAERLARREERQRALATRARKLEERATALAVDRRELVDRLGIAPQLDRELEPAPLAALAEALGRWREARAEVAGREAAIARRRAREDEIAAGLGRELERHGLAAPAGSAAAQAAVGELRRRSEIGEEVARIEGPGGELERLAERLARRGEELAELYRRLDLGPGDDAGLRALVERLDDYRQAVRDRDGAAAVREQAAAALPAEGPPEDLPLEELEAERDRLAQIAGRERDLGDEIVRLEALVDQARGRHELEDALAARERAEEDLRADRRRVAAGRVAHELGEWVKGQVRARQRPEVMRRAAELFATITRGRFRLLDPTGEHPRFRARDSAAERERALEELSSGTRLQLLAAVRMAFVEVHERGVRPPLVLDETLANSDDASARALIEAALDVARSGRQVFYFTAQDDEVAKWRAVLEAAGDGLPELVVIDLARARNLQAERRAPRRSWAPGGPPVPAPEGRSREAYAALLDVPGIDPRAEAGAVHLAHLVAEPELLHALLAQGVSRWGQLAALAEAAGDRIAAPLPGGLSEVEAGQDRWRRIRARARCVEALLRAWRQGRGEPIDRGVLAASGAVTERFLPEVTELAASLGGDARALVEALAGGAVKGFRRDKLEQLEAYLSDRGHLDDRPVLDRGGLRERAAAAVAPELAAGDLAPEAIDELLAQIPAGDGV